MKETKDGSGNKTLEYRAEDIVDFAWTAWPGYSVFTDMWKNVKITLLLPGDRKDQVDRQLQAVKNALEYFSANVGPYPWPYVNVVDPPAQGSGAGGMEYTTMFTSESAAGMPSFVHLPEMVTIHEFGHAYFMGILESNEFEEPWLDEGVNTYWENRIVDHYYGSSSGMLDLPWLKVSDSEVTRLNYVRSGSRQASTNKPYSWQFPHGTYDMMSYSKAGVVLRTLMGIIGEETMNEIFREYYRRWAFKHPSGQDLIDVANEVNTKMNGDKFGPDLNWFFSQTLFGTGICDYRVSALINNPIRSSSDSLKQNVKKHKPSYLSDSTYNSKAELERIGDVMLPVEVLVHFSDGHEVKEKWNGQSRTKDFSYTGKFKLEWAKIDPDYRIAMDVNYINNSKTIKPDRVPERRMTDKFISFLQFFMNFISL
ncbi:MAG TPA: M1 family aminopeptidase [Bacteroidales bacterium]|nr:M1 family aminopeptidase [Bacteroidales bacterium]